jgi:hypothetical protein
MPGTVPETVARVEEKVDAMGLKLSHLCLLIEGDGGVEHPGLKVQVDRLDQSEKRRTWAIHATILGFIGLAAERAWSLLK